jgi:predicted ABC-class ATPase
VARYDTACAFCRDGKPVTRHRGKAACERCQAAFYDATDPALWTDEKIRAMVRELEGRTYRDYPEPLYVRALRTRQLA